MIRHLVEILIVDTIEIQGRERALPVGVFLMLITWFEQRRMRLR